MLVLAIDSTMNGCSAGIWHSEQGRVVSKTLKMSRGQAEHLMPMIDAVLLQASKSYDEIDYIAVTQGPGAFTGMRIGIATAKALGLALNKPVIGVCTFQAVLRGHLNNKTAGNKAAFYGVLLETKRQDYYYQGFDENETQPFTKKLVQSSSEILNILKQKVDNILIIGDAFLRLQQDIKPSTISSVRNEDIFMPEIYAVAELGFKKIMEGDGTIEECTPSYLRPPEVSFSKTPPRTIKN